mmetsp:Transcript_36120/g.111770  ORF Transcript_36120/g.111770 Transcript_36120/m.111770 type:complete len:106 (-) Transcript_36120:58-375(-)
MPPPRAQRLRSDKYAANVNKRGVVETKKEKTTKSKIGPIMIGFFLFVVVGSSVLQVINMASFGSKQAEMLDKQMPRSDKAPPRKPRKKPAAAPETPKAGGAEGEM